MRNDDGLTLVLRTHDSSRVADVVVPAEMTAQELLASCVERWKLPAERDYSLQCERTRRQLVPRESLASAGVEAGDELVVYPILEAGGRS